MTVEVAPHGSTTTTGISRTRSWPLGRGEPTHVTDLFSTRHFHMIVDDRRDVHISSEDGRLYVGYYPHGRYGAHNEGWKIVVTGTAHVQGYTITFGIATPATIVAAAVASVLDGDRTA